MYRLEGCFHGKHTASGSGSNLSKCNSGRRSREYLTEREVERLVEAAKQNRSGHRDATAILMAYRHGLRASELVALRWDDIDLTTGRLHLHRAKDGGASVHPISARESRALRKLQRHARAEDARLLMSNGQKFTDVTSRFLSSGWTNVGMTT
jgi:type 1 fimbriae regulatory protein FimB/type 1 fimbriae regulatory protein FimE